jgi:hypothetical protein
MLLQDRLTAPDEQLVVVSPDAGVIEDARSRQLRHRRAGAAISLAIAIGASLAYLNAGGGNGSGHSRPPVAHGGTSFVQATTLRMPRGRTTSTFIVRAPADHAFDVSLATPSATALTLTTNFGFPGPTFNTLTDRQNCRTSQAMTSCVVHFAAGGNAGGTWRWTVTKASPAAAQTHISIVFNSHRGDYPG